MSGRGRRRDAPVWRRIADSPARAERFWYGPGGAKAQAEKPNYTPFFNECRNMHRSLERTLDECGWMRAAGAGDDSRKGGSPSWPEGC